MRVLKGGVGGGGGGGGGMGWGGVEGGRGGGGGGGFRLRCGGRGCNCGAESDLEWLMTVVEESDAHSQLLSSDRR